MNYLYEILPENILYALGWTVVHSIWQGILIAVVLAFALLSMEKKTARARYTVANFGLLALLLTSIVTFCLLYQKTPAMSLEEAFLIEAIGQSEASFWQSFTNYFNQNLPLIVSVWLMGVVFFMLKMLGGLVYIQHLKNSQNQPLSDFWQQKMNAIAQQIPLKQSVALLESALVKVPMVVGYLKPVILMPIGAINALSEEQVEAILAHELAHIYRNDYLLNILQTFIETLYYFHPAVWWISGNIRLERENCCDDLAVKLCGNPLNYAKALVSLQEMHAEAPALAMAFSSPKNQLLNRVQRILNQPQNKSNIMEKLMATTLFVVLMIMISFGANTPMSNILKGRQFSKTIEIEVEELENLNVFETTDGQTIVATFVERDTIPKKVNRSTFTKTCDGVESKISLVDGKVERLTIDGKKIAKADFDKYEKEIENMKSGLRNSSIPPPPPPPPAAPPIPPTPNGIAPPPPPPAPNKSNASSFSFSKTSKIIVTEKDEDGNEVIVIETADDKKPVKIKVQELDNGKQIISINDEKIELLSDNGRFIIKKAESGQSDILFFDEYNNRVFELNEDFPNMILPDYFAFNDNTVLEDIAISEIPFFENKTPKNLEYQRWKKRFQKESEERQKDGNLSQEWLQQKQAEEREWMKINRAESMERLKKMQAEMEEINKTRLLMNPEIPVLPNFEEVSDFEWKYVSPFLELEQLKKLEKLDDGDFFKNFQDQLILDGFIKEGQSYKLEIDEKHFKINGKKHSKKEFEKYLKLLEKQEKKRLKFQSKLS